MDYMSFTVATHVIAGESSTISDMLSDAKQLDVSSLKKDSPDGAARDFVDDSEENDARLGEVQAIEDFIKSHGVTKPTAEDFKPKKQRWGSKKSAMAGGRGRPRKTFTKDLSFVRVLQADKDLIDKEGLDVFKRAGRGRASKGQIRETFTIFHTNIDKACAGTHTRAALVAMVNG
jgi:hypothetical protein